MPSPREIDPTDATILRRAIAASGLSDRQFAMQVLVRDERTVRRWLALDRPIPEVVVAHCRELIA